MNRTATRIGLISILAVTASLVGAGVALAGTPGEIMHEGSAVNSGPSYMAPEMFKAHKGERVDIDCYTPDPDEKALHWYKVGIRGTTGWVVDSLPEDRLANIPPCGVSA